MSTFDIGARLAALERQVARMQRSTRLGHASIEDAALQVYDQDGSLRAIIGQQEDGTSGVTVVNGPPPPVPAAPTVLPSLSGVAVTWTGTFADAAATPMDFSRVEIHTTTAPDTPLGTATLKATLESPRGGTVLVTAAQPVYVRLVARNTSGAASEPSAAAGPVGPAPVVAEDILDGIVNEAKLADEAVGRMKLQVGAVGYNQLGIGTGNLIPDPGFEGPLTTNLVDTNTAWTFTDGNRSARALRVNAAAPAADQAIQLTEVPVSPGDRLFCAFDARASADWNADSLRCYFRWYDAAGETLGYGITKATPTPGGAWARYSSQQQAPAGAARAAVWLSNFLGLTGTPTGTGDFDNAEVKTVVGAGMVLADSIGTPELIAGSITAEKVAAKTLTAREVKALSLTGNEIAANTLTANHIKAGTLSADRLALGVDGNVIGDPSFEGEASVQRVEGDTYWSIVTPGSTTPKAVLVNAAAATATSRTLTLATLPVLPGQKVYLSIDYLASADWAGASVTMFAQWLDGTGASLGYSTMSATDTGGVVRDTWTTLAGVPDNGSPANTTQVRICLEAVASTAGTVTFDNAECRMVVASGTEGARAELSPLGMRLYDESGEEAVSLVTGSPNYVTLRTAGESVATIDQAGVASFQSLNVADGLTWRGDDLTTFLDQAPRGLQAIDYQITGVTSTGSEMGFVELAFDAEANRMYRVVFDAYADPSVAGGEVVLFLRDGGNGAPTINSPQIQSAIYPMSTAGLRRVRLEDLRHGQGWGVGTHHLLISFKNQVAPSGATVRLLGGSTYRGFLYVEDVGPLVLETGRYNTGGGSTTEPPPTTPAPKKYVKTYSANWSGSYARRSSYNSYYGNQMLQGYYSSTNGIQSSLVGFGGTLSSDLSGATITKAELYLYFAHWYSNSGGKAVIKAHGLTSRPSTFSSDSESMTVSWARNQGKWVDITSIFDSTKWRGIALDPNSTSNTYYGRARGVGEGNPPQLRVTYTK
ncbi:hypothetical protein ACIP6P_27040 [Streptomyces sp. NPDC088729]|uniref:hypothetical protein n=1 Tax=Streptomyces sp. NPDC088729 TaxID=3365876 RepID=UPI0037F3A03C